MNSRRLRVLIFWSRISGYMAACWKQLAALEDVELAIAAWSVSAARDNAAFDEGIVDGLNCRLDSPGSVPFDELLSMSREFGPDAVVVPGWIHPNHRKLAIELKKQFGCPVVMGMDTPWFGSAKQRLSQVIRRGQLGHVDHVITAGGRASTYAQKLGFRKHQITEGVYAWDETLFRGVAMHRDEHVDEASATLSQSTTPEPLRSNGFLFVGRYVPEKGLAELLDAYGKYRESVSDPWPLTCCGTGPLGDRLRAAAGVRDLGFQSPTSLPGIMSQSRAFLFPSTYEPWGVALAEAMGAGLPAVSTQACGAALDLITHNQNGRIIPTADPTAIADAMMWLHHHPDFGELGRRAMVSTERFTTEQWAARWHGVIRQLMDER